MPLLKYFVSKQRSIAFTQTNPAFSSDRFSTIRRLVFLSPVLLHLSPEILAAGSLVSWSFGTVVVILFGTLSSINVLVSHKYGAQDEEGLLQVVRDGFWLAIILAIPIFLLFWNMSPLFLLLGQSPEVVLLAKTYLHAMAWGILPNVLMIALLEVFMGLGRARLILLFNIFSVAVTIFFSFALIFGKFGFPMLGIAGAGWGVTISNWIAGLFFVGYALTNKNCKHYFRLFFKFTKPSYLIELVHVGAPMGLMYCVEVAFFFALTLIMGTLGSLMMAANQIALQYLGLFVSVIFSIAQAVTIRMGHLLGAGNKLDAEKSAYFGVLISTIFMLLVALCYWVLPAQLIAIDFDLNKAENKEIIHFATQFLMVSALFQIFESIRISLFGALRALKDTRFTLFISIFSFWGIALPLGYFMATRWIFGGAGLWWAMVIAAGLSVFLLLWRFKVKMQAY